MHVGGATLDVGWATVDVGGATSVVGGSTLDVGWATVDVVSRSPDPFLSGYCAITGWKGSGSFLKCNCSMSVGTRTRCKSNTSLMWYHKSS